MNVCVFYGELIQTPVVSEENGVQKIQLCVRVENRRKNKKNNDIIDKEDLIFEAWDSAAFTIQEYAEVGDFVLIKAYAKTGGIFRITEFNILYNQSFEYEGEV